MRRYAAKVYFNFPSTFQETLLCAPLSEPRIRILRSLKHEWRLSYYTERQALNKMLAVSRSNN